jgi:hypothetical protein
MLFSEFEQEKSKPDAPVPDSSLKIEQGPDDSCVVDGLYPLPLESTSRLYPRGQSIAVLDINGATLGELLTCSGEEFALPRFSAGYLASYLADIPQSMYGQAGVFSHDYLLVEKDRLAEYRSEYLGGSAIWGGFQHVQPPTSTYVVTSSDSIKAIKGVILPTDIHIEAASRSVAQPYAFERFLKLYHLLELSFDRCVVMKIQALGPDLKGIGQILSGWDSNELNRLKQIMLECHDAIPVIECIRALTADTRWRDHIKTIFFEYGKAGNPLVNKEQEFLSALSADGYTLQALQPIAGIQGGRPSPVQQKAFETFTLCLAAYWIYRVRSSIAHNRIGEYLMRAEDEPFVTFFAEPLLRCVLTQVLR